MVNREESFPIVACLHNEFLIATEDWQSLLTRP